MPDILHRVGFKSSSPADAYKALTTIEGLSSWWTRDTDGGAKVGDVLRFRFGEKGGFDMKVIALDPGKRVSWEVVEGPAEWLGTTVCFDLAQDGEFTVLHFEHRGWKEQVEFMAHCSTKWATFLMSLKSLVETGKGEAWPDDVQISNWH